MFGLVSLIGIYFAKLFYKIEQIEKILSTNYLTRSHYNRIAGYVAALHYTNDDEIK